jgi:hypothetical protein
MASNRLVYTATRKYSDRVVKIHRLSETNEFRARLYVAGKAVVDADYFSSGITKGDLDDAIATAEKMVMPPEPAKPVLVDIPVEQVKVGDILWEADVRWNVLKNTYDPKGNTGNQKRHLLDLKLVEGETLPDYMRGCETWGTGRLVGMMVSIVKRA